MSRSENSGIIDVAYGTSDMLYAVAWVSNVSTKTIAGVTARCVDQ